jgi:hypothetical protein
MTTKTTKTAKAKTPSAEFVIADITEEIHQERLSQIARWGQQDHPSSASELDRKRAEKNADHWKQRNDARAEAGILSWDGILLEEVWEALAEEDETRRREELIQVAAVAAAEVEAIDRRLAAQAKAQEITLAVADSANERSCPETGQECDLECKATCLLREVKGDEPA